MEEYSFEDLVGQKPKKEEGFSFEELVGQKNTPDTSANLGNLMSNSPFANNKPEPTAPQLIARPEYVNRWPETSYMRTPESGYTAGLADGQEVIVSTDGKSQQFAKWNAKSGNFELEYKEKVVQPNYAPGAGLGMGSMPYYAAPQMVSRIKSISPDSVVGYTNAADKIDTAKVALTRSLIPTASGFAGFAGGATIGAELGAFGGPLGATIGGLIGGGIGGFGGGLGGQAIQDTVFPIDKEQQLALASNPNTAGIASFAPALIAAPTSPRTWMNLGSSAPGVAAGAAKQLGTNAALMGAMGTGNDVGGNLVAGRPALENVGLGSIAHHAATGLVLGHPNAIGRAMEFPGRLAAKPTAWMLKDIRRMNGETFNSTADALAAAAAEVAAQEQAAQQQAQAPAPAHAEQPAPAPSPTPVEQPAPAPVKAQEAPAPAPVANEAPKQAPAATEKPAPTILDKEVSGLNERIRFIKGELIRRQAEAEADARAGQTNPELGRRIERLKGSLAEAEGSLESLKDRNAPRSELPTPKPEPTTEETLAQKQRELDTINRQLEAAHRRNADDLTISQLEVEQERISNEFEDARLAHEQGQQAPVDQPQVTAREQKPVQPPVQQPVVPAREATPVAEAPKKPEPKGIQDARAQLAKLEASGNGDGNQAKARRKYIRAWEKQNGLPYSVEIDGPKPKGVEQTAPAQEAQQNAPARPESKGDDTSAADAWDAQYGETHWPSGNPKQAVPGGYSERYEGRFLSDDGTVLIQKVGSRFQVTPRSGPDRQKIAWQTRTLEEAVSWWEKNRAKTLAGSNSEPLQKRPVFKEDQAEQANLRTDAEITPQESPQAAAPKGKTYNIPGEGEVSERRYLEHLIETRDWNKKYNTSEGRKINDKLMRDLAKKYGVDIEAEAKRLAEQRSNDPEPVEEDMDPADSPTSDVGLVRNEGFSSEEVNQLRDLGLQSMKKQLADIEAAGRGESTQAKKLRETIAKREKLMADSEQAKDQQKEPVESEQPVRDYIRDGGFPEGAEGISPEAQGWDVVGVSYPGDGSQPVYKLRKPGVSKPKYMWYEDVFVGKKWVNEKKSKAKDSGEQNERKRIEDEIEYLNEEAASLMEVDPDEADNIMARVAELQDKLDAMDAGEAPAAEAPKETFDRPKLERINTGLDGVENYRQNQQTKKQAEGRLSNLVKQLESMFPGIVDRVTSDEFIKRYDLPSREVLASEPHEMAKALMREVRGKLFPEVTAQMDRAMGRDVAPEASEPKNASESGQNWRERIRTDYTEAERKASLNEKVKEYEDSIARLEKLANGKKQPGAMSPKEAQKQLVKERADLEKLKKGYELLQKDPELQALADAMAQMEKQIVTDETTYSRIKKKDGPDVARLEPEIYDRTKRLLDKGYTIDEINGAIHADPNPLSESQRPMVQAFNEHTGYKGGGVSVTKEAYAKWKAEHGSQAEQPKAPEAPAEQVEPAKEQPVTPEVEGEYPIDRFESALEKKGIRILRRDNTDDFVAEGGVEDNGRQRPTIVVGDTKVTLSSEGMAFTRGKVQIMDGHEVDASGNVIYSIERIVTAPEGRGKGSASKAIAEVTEAADKAGLTLQLEPTPFRSIIGKGESLSKQQLIEWYKRHGFEQKTEGSDAILIRKPRSPEKASKMAGMDGDQLFAELDRMGEEKFKGGMKEMNQVIDRIEEMFPGSKKRIMDKAKAQQNHDVARAIDMYVRSELNAQMRKARQSSTKESATESTGTQYEADVGRKKFKELERLRDRIDEIEMDDPEDLTKDQMKEVSDLKEKIAAIEKDISENHKELWGKKNSDVLEHVRNGIKEHNDNFEPTAEWIQNHPGVEWLSNSKKGFKYDPKSKNPIEVILNEGLSFESHDIPDAAVINTHETFPAGTPIETIAEFVRDRTRIDPYSSPSQDSTNASMLRQRIAKIREEIASKKIDVKDRIDALGDIVSTENYQDKRKNILVNTDWLYKQFKKGLVTFDEILSDLKSRRGEDQERATPKGKPAGSDEIETSIKLFEDRWKQLVKEDSDRVAQIGDSRSKAEKWADDTIREGKKNLNTGLDPFVITAYAVKGAIKFGRHLKNFAEFSREMLKEFGDGIRPHLQAIFDKAQEPNLVKDYVEQQEARAKAGQPEPDLAKISADMAEQRAQEREQTRQIAQGQKPELSAGGKAWRSVVDHPIVAYAKYIGMRMRTVADLNPQSPTAQKVVNDFSLIPGTKETGPDFNTEHSNQLGIFFNKFSQALGPVLSDFRKMSPEQKAKFSDLFIKAVEGRLPREVGGEVGDAVKRFRKVMDELHQYGVDAGLEIGKVTDYFPRGIDADAVQANRKGFEEAAARAYELQWERQQKEALGGQGEFGFADGQTKRPNFREMARKWADAIILGHEGLDFERSIFEEGNPSSKEDFQKSREFTKEEAAEFDAFRDKDFETVLTKHVGNSVRRAEISRRLGSDGNKWGELASKMSREGVSPEHIAELKEMIQSNLGVNKPTDKSNRTGRKSAAALDVYNLISTAAYLKATGLLNLAEATGGGLRSANPVRAATDIFTNLARVRNVMTRTTPEQSQAMKTEIERIYGKGHDLAAALAIELGINRINHGLGSISSGYHLDGGSDRAGGIRQKNDAVYRLYGIHATEVAKRETSLVNAMDFMDNAVKLLDGETNLQRIFKAAGKDVKADTLARDRLMELGVKAENVDGVTQFVRELRGMDGDAQLKKIMSNEPMAVEYRKALTIFNKQASVQATPASRTQIANESSFGKILFQFQTFANEWTAQHGRYMAEQAKKVVLNPGDRYTPAERLMAAGTAPAYAISIAAMAGIRALVNAITGFEVKDDGKVPVWVKTAADAVVYTGILGPTEMLYKAAIREQMPLGVAGEWIKNALQVYGRLKENPESDAAQRAGTKMAYRSAVVPAAVTGLATVAPNPLTAVAAQVVANNRLENKIADEVAGDDNTKGAPRYPKRPTPPAPPQR